MPIVRADQVFSTAAGFTASELERIWKAAAGRTLSFSPPAESPDERAARQDELLAMYARGATTAEVAGKAGVSQRQVFRLLAATRDEGLSPARAATWRSVGLSWRELGRLYGISHEAARQAAGHESNADGLGAADSGPPAE